MDGSRLYAEHKYCNLIARQRWAFAVLDVDAVVIAAASGRTPQWANGIHATELWALLHAAQMAYPGSPSLTDCKAVQRGTVNGASWMQAPSRLYGRAWSPLATALEGETATWMPAHNERSAIGVASLSDGTRLRLIDIIGNDTVDLLAKAVARANPPSDSERNLITYTSYHVREIARWIGRCNVLANHFPVVDSEGNKSFIRDSEANRTKAKPKKKARIFSEVAAASDPVPSPPTVLVSQPVLSTGNPCVVFSSPLQVPRTTRKRKRFSSRDADRRDDAFFLAHWQDTR